MENPSRVSSPSSLKNPLSPKHYNQYGFADVPLIHQSSSKLSKNERIHKQIHQNLEQQKKETVRRAKYFWHRKEENYKERDHVKERRLQQEKLQELKRKKAQLALVERQKTELLEAERKKREQINSHGQGCRNAETVTQLIEQRKEDKLQKERRNSRLSLERYNKALARMRSQENLMQQRQYRQKSISKQKRQTHRQFANQARAEAQKYRDFIEEQQESLKAQQEEMEKQEFQRRFRGILSCSSTDPKQINFDSSCFHSEKHRVLVLQSQKETYQKPHQKPQRVSSKQTLNTVRSQSSMQKAARQNEAVRKRKEELELTASTSRKKSIERHQSSVQRLRAEREYKQYTQEMEARQLNYELARVETGKRNPKTGLKPETLQRLKTENDARLQKEFERIFFSQEPENSQQCQRKNQICARMQKTRECKINPFNPLIGKFYFQEDCYSDREDEVQNKPRNKNPIWNQFRSEFDQNDCHFEATEIVSTQRGFQSKGREEQRSHTPIPDNQKGNAQILTALEYSMTEAQDHYEQQRGRLMQSSSHGNNESLSEDSHY